ncbi:hypothetical protein HOY82DRAFT_543111 [Tuber indicum]|nr:hypothetical protein HOY82DRAFT_543111 [Tuber indicum]
MRHQEEELTDIDDDYIPRHLPRAQKCHVEPFLQQQPWRVCSQLRFVSESNNIKNGMITRKSMEDSPSLALNGSSERLLSQEQAAQLHSDHLRAHSSYFSPYTAEAEHVLPSRSIRSMVNLEIPASDIGAPATLLPKSNTLHGE